MSLNNSTMTDIALSDDGGSPDFSVSLLELDASPSILGHLTESEKAEVLSCGRRMAYTTGETFFCQGDPHDGIHMIESGRVRSFYISPAGREITLAYWTAGHFVGAPEMFSDGEYMWTSEAIEPSRATWLAGDVLFALVRQIPNLALGLIDGLIYKGKCYSSLLQLMGTSSMSMRLAHLLLALVDTPSDDAPERFLISKRFSHAELANMVGSTRQWVSLTLKRFEDDRLIAFDGTSIAVLRPDKLKNICF
jgi:CRP/FNR family cyclic AMP-dependent transcriptional regulator